LKPAIINFEIVEADFLIGQCATPAVVRESGLSAATSETSLLHKLEVNLPLVAYQKFWSAQMSVSRAGA
jgi:hypothetical protein